MSTRPQPRRGRISERRKSRVQPKLRPLLKAESTRRAPSLIRTLTRKIRRPELSSTTARPKRLNKFVWVGSDIPVRPFSFLLIRGAFLTISTRTVCLSHTFLSLQQTFKHVEEFRIRNHGGIRSLYLRIPFCSERRNRKCHRDAVISE